MTGWMGVDAIWVGWTYGSWRFGLGTVGKVDVGEFAAIKGWGGFWA